DFDAARSVLTRLSGSAVVVLMTSMSGMADIFDASALNYGIDVPSGLVTPPRPVLSGLAPFDAISKFLDQNSGLAASSLPVRGLFSRVDVGSVLSESAGAALIEVVRQGRRARIPAKARGFLSVESDADAFAEVLHRA